MGGVPTKNGPGRVVIWPMIHARRLAKWAGTGPKPGRLFSATEGKQMAEEIQIPHTTTARLRPTRKGSKSGRWTSNMRGSKQG